MSDPIIQQAKNKVNPDLKDVLDLLSRNIKMTLNCHAIAQIQSFDPAKQTVSATLMYKKTVFKRQTNSSYKSTLADYPILLDVPAVVLGGGSSHLTFPIAKGDECVILFNDRSIDNWFKSSQVGPLASANLHSFSDGLALVGVNSLKNSLQNYDMTRAVLYNGTTLVGVSSSKVKIANQSTTLNTQIQALCTQLGNLTTALQALTVICAAPGSASSVPVNVAAITAVGTQISSIATQLGGLLE